MKEYIEREAAMNIVFADDIDKDYPRMDIAARLHDIPAADVREVVRGHWITEAEAEKLGDYALKDTCSVCGHCDWDNTESKYFDFCPNCGAEMRQKEET